MEPLHEEFFDKLYREHFNELKFYAYRFVKDLGDAEFAVQDAFVVVLNNIVEAMDRPDVISWMWSERVRN